MHRKPSQNTNAVVPEHIITALGRKPLLRGLMAAAAGFAQRSAEPLGCAGAGPGQASFIYCVRGSGWCDTSCRLRALHPGDLLVLPPVATSVCRSRASDPWTIHWARATGTLLRDYLEALDCGIDLKVLHVGDDPELVRLFNEILRSLQRGTLLSDLLRASHALAHLMAVLIEKHHSSSVADRSTTQRIGEAIIYMSEHLDEPVSISALARLASLSPTYFTGLFKKQTGCAPRDYLHLLRIHRACQLLNSSGLTIKQIASRVGYQDPFHFSRQFKAFQGVSPSQYRGSPPA